MHSNDKEVINSAFSDSVIVLSSVKVPTLIPVLMSIV